MTDYEVGYEIGSKHYPAPIGVLLGLAHAFSYQQNTGADTVPYFADCWPGSDSCRLESCHGLRDGWDAAHASRRRACYKHMDLAARPCVSRQEHLRRMAEPCTCK